MPYSKEFMNGFDEPVYSKRYKKRKFDKSTVVPDTEKSCHECIFSELLMVERKKNTYKCQKTNYIFFNYWKQTIAKDCKLFKKNE